VDAGASVDGVEFVVCCALAARLKRDTTITIFAIKEPNSNAKSSDIDLLLQAGQHLQHGWPALPWE
jgi:hypothetical protein